GVGAGGERRRRGCRAGCRAAGVERVLTAREGAAMPVVLAMICRSSESGHLRPRRQYNQSYEKQQANKHGER
ncbi:MAG: hypothetical protein OXU61_06650, partial [Gammaproteobacteria bacterium]|nr:hypothetical protein [Gammaproteobacteria bacterium]